MVLGEHKVEEAENTGRRRFLTDLARWTGAAALSGSVGSLLTGCAGGSNTSVPFQDTPGSFTFAVIGDPHVGARDSAAFCSAGSKAIKLLINAVSDINARGVDFTIVLGDIADQGEPAQLLRAKTILDGLQSPYIPIAGNHDTIMGDDFAAFKQTFSAPELNYSWDYRGFHFTTANCSNGTYVYPLVRWPHETLEWIKWDLQQHPGQPTFFICHHNLWPYDQRQTVTEPWWYQVPAGGDELRDILEQSGTVFMSLSGHIHSFRYCYTTMAYATVGCPPVYPSQIMYYHVHPDRVEAEAVTLSNKGLVDYAAALASAEMRPLIDGALGNKQYTVPVFPQPPSSLLI